MDKVERLVIKAENLEHGVASLYCLYEGRDEPQGAHVKINPVLAVDPSEIINADVVTIISCDYNDILDQSDAYAYIENTSKYIDCPPDVLNKALLEYLHSSEFESKALRLCSDFRVNSTIGVDHEPHIVGVWNDQALEIIADIEGDLEALERAEIHLGHDWIKLDISYKDKYYAIYNHHNPHSGCDKEIEIHETNLDALVDAVKVEASIEDNIEVVNIRQAFEDILEDINQPS